MLCGEPSSGDAVFCNTVQPPGAPVFLNQKEVLPGFEPGYPDSESGMLTNYIIEPYVLNTPSETRTRNLTLRRGAPYPLGHGGTDIRDKKCVHGESNPGHLVGSEIF